MRYRVTIRRDAPYRTELRGYIDNGDALSDVATALATLDPMCMVIASPAPDRYDPFNERQGA